MLHPWVQWAQDLLQHTNLTMREISTQCGLADIHRFIQAFERIVGQAPASYRPANQSLRRAFRGRSLTGIFCWCSWG
ncbi:MAG: helix-turn-helix domain-containing protein [Rubrobacter sp.]|nr:helix-turn-helix domain-containing protein [Rubrobacter sp.]